MNDSERQLNGSKTADMTMATHRRTTIFFDFMVFSVEQETGLEPATLRGEPARTASSIGSCANGAVRWVDVNDRRSDGNAECVLIIMSAGTLAGWLPFDVLNVHPPAVALSWILNMTLTKDGLPLQDGFGRDAPSLARFAIGRRGVVFSDTLLQVMVKGG